MVMFCIRALSYGFAVKCALWYSLHVVRLLYISGGLHIATDSSGTTWNTPQDKVTHMILETPTASPVQPYHGTHAVLQNLDNALQGKWLTPSFPSTNSAKNISARKPKEP
jgi:hypothetical protein